jgi:hypothetical protein
MGFPQWVAQPVSQKMRPLLTGHCGTYGTAIVPKVCRYVPGFFLGTAKFPGFSLVLAIFPVGMAQAS